MFVNALDALRDTYADTQHRPPCLVKTANLSRTVETILPVRNDISTNQVIEHAVNQGNKQQTQRGC